MRNQVLAIPANPIMPSTLLIREKLSRILSRKITLPRTTKNLVSTARIIFALSVSALFLGSSIGYGGEINTPTSGVDRTFSWLTKTPYHVSDNKDSAPVVDTPDLPCDQSLINNTFSWLSQCPEFSISFADKPNGPVDRKIFNFYTGAPEANQEAQLYTDDLRNISIENGALTIRALNSPSNTYQYSSARIDTKGKKDFKYGRIEIKAMLPKNIGAWPAIWMLSSDRIYQALNPERPNSYLNDGEIDIAEAVGTEPNVVYGIAHSLVHSTPNYFGTIKVPDNHSEYHTYGLDWTPTRLSFTLDGTEYFSMNKPENADYRTWPYDQKFYLVINLALGGTWGGTDKYRFPPDGVNSSELPFTMKIQSINYYSYKP